MEIKVGFSLWRSLRLFGLFIALLSLYVGVWFVGTLLFPAQLPIIQLVTFIILLIVALYLAGSPDQALQAWHERQLHNTRELYSTLYNQSPVPYLTLNKKNRIAICNQAAARLFGVTIDELIGQLFIDRLTHEDDDHLSVILGKFEAGATILGEEVQLTTFANEIRWVAFSHFVNDTFDQKLVSLVDVTQHKIVDKAKSEFVALATHQLRTPVAAIRWNVELLERSMRGNVTDKQNLYLAKVSRNVLRMLALINDFLSVSKLETGTFATEKEPVTLAGYLAVIVEEFEGQIKEKQITVVETYEPTDLVYTTDTRLFHILTSNLLSNAVKYVRPQGTIDFGYKLVGQQLVFTVRDTGIGIPADQLPFLFTKFFRASNAIQHRAEGTGLGLYIVKESITQLGGTIDVSSVENEGTTFTIRLPLTS